MSDYIVSARKYRPATFKSVVGQDHISQTLKNAIVHNKVAQAYLFTGPRGVGKTTCARIMAKSLNCLNLHEDGEPCNECDSCKNFNEQRSMNIYELDAASNNSVEDIRALVDQVRFAPQAGKYKVYIIDEVHMLSQSAFNAFLKTLEEPPSYAIFILATTEKHKIIPTILSRCQIFDFNRIQIRDIVEHLKYISGEENIESEETALHIIAQKADGALRDALSIFDRIVSFTGSKVTYRFVIDNLNIIDYEYFFKLTSFVVDKNISQTLLLFNDIINLGFDGQNLIQGMSEHFRNLLVAKTPDTLELLEIPDDVKNQYIEQARKMNLSFVLTALNILNQFNINYKESKNQRLHTELCLIKLCHIRDAIELASLAGEQKKKVAVEKKTAPEYAGQEITSKEQPKPYEEAEDKTTSIVEDQKNEKKDEVDPPKPETTSRPKRLDQLRELAKNGFKNGQSSNDQENGNNTEDAQDKPINIDFDKVKSAIFDYRDANLKGHRPNLYNALKKNEPEYLGENKIQLYFENKALESMFIEIKQDLNNFLYEKYEMQSIIILTIVKPPTEEEKSKYLVNPKDKYEYLKNKNPELENLQRALGLQPEE